MPTAPVAQVNEGQIPVIRDEPLNHEEGEKTHKSFWLIETKMLMKW
jgi:hypothetical protein